MYTAIYFDEVVLDIQKAKIWYKEQKEGLEIEFASAIEEAINSILKMPSKYAIRYKNIRISHPKKFPYNIHFYLDDEAKIVTFTAIIHNKRADILVKNRI